MSTGPARPRAHWPAIALLALALAACSAQTDSALTGRPSLATARVALSTGSPAIALTVCTGLLEKHPDDTELLNCKGDALTSLGRNAEAVATYLAALKIDPRNGDSKLGLGRLRLATDPAAAEALFLEALTSNPRNAAALNDLGIARDLQGRHADAQTAYGEAIAAAPEQRAAQVNLALSLALSGRPAEAVRILRPIAERPTATARERHDLAAALAMDNKTEESARLLRQDLPGTEVDDAVNGFRSLPPH